ncbi:hypothetical protein PAHAL_9G211300 [Panicum hallii]|jgi:hypothetical protein|uniref:RlpA-like protein double-psi beta-barrel domain-containing protein n=1 Tax=Panicum hallii TaxID=206008 RepID=A0A2S3IL96_9POAL|nr:putative ripening-related protein 6 [Panicum hallii]PAN46734.1 hypothetical protein PAHAL_9G211300 [Panicum hallii]
MARAKLAFLAAAAAVLLLLLAPSRAVARHHHRAPAVSPNKGGGTRAVMTVNGFEKGQEGGGPAACDGHYHSNGDLIAALSTGWFAGGRRCHKPIRITSAHNGRSVVARVVDECDSRHGCRTNVVDTSKAVWDALGLDTNVGVVPVTWSDA